VRPPWLAVCLWAGLILLLTSWPPRHLPAGPHGFDKVVHLLLYAPLAALLANALRGGSTREHGATEHAFLLLKAITICLAFGALDEWHQQFCQRQPSVLDWYADCVGVMVGAAGALLWRRRADGGSTTDQRQ
jgi:VanZ family protein